MSYPLDRLPHLGRNVGFSASVCLKETESKWAAAVSCEFGAKMTNHVLSTHEKEHRSGHTISAQSFLQQSTDFMDCKLIRRETL